METPDASAPRYRGSALTPKLVEIREEIADKIIACMDAWVANPVTTIEYRNDRIRGFVRAAVAETELTLTADDRKKDDARAAAKARANLHYGRRSQ